MNCKVDWMIYGVYLLDDNLEKIYNKNALKIMKMFTKNN